MFVSHSNPWNFLTLQMHILLFIAAVQGQNKMQLKKKKKGYLHNGEVSGEFNQS